ncbi:hypothetical protein BDV37DRAFT_272790 [Aspergillus pseudonomiae]|uniref:Uncharacterized protein n=1 Tax=Aspergillus pseudonomiae TaxID=1506151 RepID=A0A5N7D8E7_9EURO|nr:uncharacterized protein BDV37DRAFT_272790 [Aspergillus pseudonomiae]KAE8402475.1 hypothetical protein BDV37DRAFT_272790 [Aspergillus pseudonomiae]
MPHLFHLPLELLAQAISYVDQSTLKCLRRTCRTLAQVTSPQLFRVVRLRLQLKRFPNVQSTVLRFDDIYLWRGQWPQNPACRKEILRVFLSWLASLGAPIKELGVRNLHGGNIDDAEIRTMITKALGSLRSLRLNIVIERLVELVESPADEIQYHEAHEFFEEMSSNWLNPTMGSLEHLTLHCDQKWLFLPKVDFHGIRFPRLKTLALGNFAFWLNSQVDITQEREWWRPGCPERSDYYRSGEKLWNDLFGAFRTGLPFLRHFRMGSTCWSYSDGEMPFVKETSIYIGLLHDRYMGCRGTDPDDRMSKVNEKAAQENREFDRTALRLLLESVGQRVPPSWSTKGICLRLAYLKTLVERLIQCSKQAAGLGLAGA